MRALRTAYWLGVWLLSPSRGGLMLKCVLIGVVVKLVTVVVGVAVVLPVELVLPGAAGEAEERVQPLATLAVEALLLAPIVETLMMAAVFGVLGRVLRLHPAVPCAVIVVGAVLLHELRLGTGVFVAIAFAAMSVQYVRFREVLPLGSTLWGVAVTHATLNACAMAVAVATGDSSIAG